MTRKGCSFGRRKHGRCPSRKDGRKGGLSGINRVCIRYKVVGKGKNTIMRCATFIPESGVPPFRGQRKGFSEGTAHNQRRSIVHASF